jgi:Putative beta-barrel porin 2
MTNLKSLRALVIAALAFAICSHPQAVRGAGEASDGSDLTGRSDMGIFSKLPFKLSLTLREGYDDNANNTVTAKQGSWFTNGELDLAYDFGSPRTKLTLGAGIGGTYFYERVAIQNYDIDIHAGLDITHKATPRLTLRSTLYGAYLTEPNFTFGYGVNRRSGNYFYTGDKFTATYEWAPRFATATSYTLNAIQYDGGSLATFEDRVENTFGNEFRFLAQPTTALVAEYRYQIITYSHIARDSTTHFALGGIDHSFTPRFSASVRGGMQFRDYQATGHKTAPYFESAVNYAAGKRTTISWTNRYGIEEPDLPTVRSRTTYRTGLQAKQKVFPRVTATLGLYYEHDDNQAVSVFPVFSPPFSENAVDIAFSGHYAITRYLSIEAGYNRTQVISDLAFREYTRNRFYGGLSFAF